MLQPQVRIQNPVSGNPYTSFKSALRNLKRGLARWYLDGKLVTDPEFIPGLDLIASRRVSVEFIRDPDDYRACAIKISAERLMQLGYDREVVGGLMASLDAIKHLPVAGDPAKVFTTANTRARRIPLFRRLAPCVTLLRDGQPVEAR